jgi:hypothetical protein
MTNFGASLVAALLSAATPIPDPAPVPVPVFVGEITPTDRPDRPFVEQRFFVRPNVIEMARNARVLELELPWSGTAQFNVRAFDPDAGFTINEDGTVIPSDDPTELTYYLQANGQAGQLFITVRSGRVLLDLVGADPASVRPGADSHTLDDLDRAYLGTAKCGVNTSAAPVVSFSPTTSALVPSAPKSNFEVTIMVAYTP